MWLCIHFLIQLCLPGWEIKNIHISFVSPQCFTELYDGTWYLGTWFLGVFHYLQTNNNYCGIKLIKVLWQKLFPFGTAALKRPTSEHHNSSNSRVSGCLWQLFSEMGRRWGFYSVMYCVWVWSVFKYIWSVTVFI